MKQISFETQIPVPQQMLYDYHASGSAFLRLSPPWQKISIQQWKGGEKTLGQSPFEQFGDISKGAEVSISLKKFGISLPMVAKHIGHQAPFGFVDQQRKGPFKHWVHHHQFTAIYDRCALQDKIEYQPPIPVLADRFIQKDIEKLFAYRHYITKSDLMRHAKYSEKQRLKIVISGASGLVGKQLAAFLQTGGHHIFRLVRHKTNHPQEIYWNIQENEIEHEKLEQMDVIIHLAGETISKRWTPDQKEKILSSREKGTLLLSQTIVRLKRPPSVFISASAVGFYENSDSATYTEDTPPSNHFLGEVCERWENATNCVKEKGIRVVHPRIGVVLSARGGALPQMLQPFYFGVGGKVGSGKQWLSWIALEDLIGLIHEMIWNEKYVGPINATTPNPLRNEDFTKIVAKILKRPSFFAAPSVAIKMLFGEMGQNLLLEGAKVLPAKALSHGFEFEFADIESCLRFELGKKN